MIHAAVSLPLEDWVDQSWADRSGRRCQGPMEAMHDRIVAGAVDVTALDPVRQGRLAEIMCRTLYADRLPPSALGYALADPDLPFAHQRILCGMHRRRASLDEPLSPLESAISGVGFTPLGRDGVSWLASRPRLSRHLYAWLAAAHPDLQRAMIDGCAARCDQCWAMQILAHVGPDGRFVHP